VTRSLPSGAALLRCLCAVVVAGACRPAAPAPPAPVAAAWPRDEYCWWMAIRTPLPVDSVRARFSRAFATVGLTDITSQRVGDTILVRGGPTELGAATSRGIYASRAVAYQHGDSTRFRWYSSVVPSSSVATAADSESVVRRHIGFCGEIGKAVAIKGFTTRDPTADDSITVWTRLP
jgi:hypothetical protein